MPPPPIANSKSHTCRMIHAGTLVVQHHVFHLHDHCAVAVVRSALQSLIRLLIFVQFVNDVQQTVAQIAGQCW